MKTPSSLTVNGLEGRGSATFHFLMFNFILLNATDCFFPFSWQCLRRRRLGLQDQIAQYTDGKEVCAAVQVKILH